MKINWYFQNDSAREDDVVEPNMKQDETYAFKWRLAATQPKTNKKESFQNTLYRLIKACY